MNKNALVLSFRVSFYDGLRTVFCGTVQELRELSEKGSVTSVEVWAFEADYQDNDSYRRKIMTVEGQIQCRQFIDELWSGPHRVLIKTPGKFEYSFPDSIMAIWWTSSGWMCNNAGMSHRGPTFHDAKEAAHSIGWRLPD